jgi:hypothetical protein
VAVANAIITATLGNGTTIMRTDGFADPDDEDVKEMLFGLINQANVAADMSKTYVIGFTITCAYDG